MRFSKTIFASLLLTTVFSGCAAYELNAPRSLPPELPLNERCNLSLSVHEGQIPRREYFFYGTLPIEHTRRIDDLSPYSEAFRRTGLVRVDHEASDVRCDLSFGTRFLGASTDGVLSALTLGFFPGRAFSESVLQAKVSRAGREPALYEFRCKCTNWIWLPLMPFGVVQMARYGFDEWSKPNGLPVLVEALVFRLEEDGWLSEEGK